MVIDNFGLSVVGCTIFLLGAIFRKYGLAGMGEIVSLLTACFFLEESSFPYGVILSIAFFVATMIFHGRAVGRSSPLYKYNPYAPDNQLPAGLRLFLLVMATIVSLIAMFSLLAMNRS